MDKPELKSDICITSYCSPCLPLRRASRQTNQNYHKMKEIIIKATAAVLTLIGLLLMIGDMPDASVLGFVSAKAGGAALLLLTNRIWEEYIPEEEV